MNSPLGLLVFGLFMIAGCAPGVVQQPPVFPPQPPVSAQQPHPDPNPDPSIVNPNSPTTAQGQSQISGSQRWQHAWGKALEGLALGGAVGGLYGAGGGLVIGLIAGLVTADSHYGAINSQIQVEQQKDRALEAAIEQELERQRSLEGQIAQASPPKPENPPVAQPVADANQPQTPLPQGKPPDNITVASRGSPPSLPAAPKPFKNVDVKDINGDGVPDLWIYYNPQKPGEIMRQEEASKGDGIVDTWSYFKDGKLVRREVDTKAHGKPDTSFYYANDQIAREERDENGEGRVTYRAVYENGRLARLEKDANGSGKMSLWVYYDTAKEGEVVSKEERDLNGDGAADLWSYYENGRLVRRDVSAIGLEILSKQEQIPVTVADPKQISAPGS
jgi:hypothetical protein